MAGATRIFTGCPAVTTSGILLFTQTGDAQMTRINKTATPTKRIPSATLEKHLAGVLNRFGYNSVHTSSGPLMRGPNGEYYSTHVGVLAPYNPDLGV
jgi:hypothetical protein